MNPKVSKELIVVLKMPRSNFYQSLQTQILGKLQDILILLSFKIQQAILVHLNLKHMKNLILIQLTLQNTKVTLKFIKI